MSNDNLQERAINTLRFLSADAVQQANSGHPGLPMGAAAMTYTIWTLHLRHNPRHPRWPDRDRFILSGGHGSALLYSLLHLTGYDLSLDELKRFRQWGSLTPGHPEYGLTPGVETTSGSLGQGLSFGVGAALAGRLDSRSYHVYVVLGDGECDEGQVWEAAMAAAHFKLDNLTAIIDHNQLQLDGWNRDIMNLEPLGDKWRAFGWQVTEVDGHNMASAVAALEQARANKGKPTAIIARTVKGKGVSFMENNVDFHGRAPSASELATALEELK